MTQLDRDGENGENRCCSDQKGMVCDVLEEAIHSRASMLTAAVRFDGSGRSKGAQYNSRPAAEVRSLARPGARTA